MNDMNSAQFIYNQNIRPLPLSERLKIASLIIEDISHSPSVLRWDDSWSEEDLHDLALFAQRNADKCYPENDEQV